jgi:hypothetical protein
MKWTLVVAVLLAGCGPKAPKVAPAPCTGNQVAIVRSSFPQPVDVYAYFGAAGRAPFILGTVQAQGREEFTLPAETSYVTYRLVRDPQYRGPHPSMNDILIQIVCR